MRANRRQKKEKGTEDISRERGVEIQLKAAAQRSYPEDATDPMVAPQDYDIRQSGRILELQNRDLWLRPTDMSWQQLKHRLGSARVGDNVLETSARRTSTRMN